MGLEIGQQIIYDLVSSSSVLDRMKGSRMIQRGMDPVGSGYIHSIDGDDVLISTRLSTGLKRIKRRHIHGIS